MGEGWVPGPTLLPGHTCHRISTEVVVWGVTEMMVGAPSGAGERGRQVSFGGWHLGPLGGHRDPILWTLNYGQLRLQSPSTPTTPTSAEQRAEVKGERGWDLGHSPNPRVQSPILLLLEPKASDAATELPHCQSLVFWGRPPT